ncbi:MAG: YkgJ family cysteine cluster protein [Deltaproteobacteria bacterium]|nr:YkgJ family cysteine cluster protein [Deltaproteobacteria bacterium]
MNSKEASFGRELVTNPERVRELGARMANENLRWRTRLKNGSYSSAQIDRAFHEVFKLIQAEIDCTQCGVCCRDMSFELGAGDIQRLARHLNLSIADFRSTYVLEESEEETLATPCPFLKCSRCSCYEARPEVCRSFPHLDKPDMTSRLLGVISNAERCPIVFNVVEHMKDRFAEEKGR